MRAFQQGVCVCVCALHVYVGDLPTRSLYPAGRLTDMQEGSVELYVIKMIPQPSNQLGAGRQYGGRLAGGCSLPLGPALRFDSQSRLARRLPRRWKGVGGGREQGAPEQPVSL